MIKFSIAEMAKMLWKAAYETYIMVSWSLLAGLIFGALIGLLLFLMSNQFFFKNKIFNNIANFIINATRSIPFLILMVTVLPFCQLLAGVSIGPKAMIVPLAIAAIAFYARLVENAFSQIDKGVIEAAVASGASHCRIIVGILFPEAMAQLIRHATVMAISLISFSSMAGVVGGGGIGDLAIHYGYERNAIELLIACTVILIFIVMVIQYLGDKLANHFDKSHK
jgi:D-methionine transport system permease protein